MVNNNENKLTREPRSTQNKTPARYILTPTPPPKKNQITNENFDLYSAKYKKLNDKQSNKHVGFDLNIPSSSSIMMPQIDSEVQPLQNFTQERFNIYRRGVRNVIVKSNKKCRAFGTTKPLNSMNFDNDDDDEQEIHSSASECSVDENDEREEEEEKPAEHMNEEQNKSEDEIDDSDEDEGNNVVRTQQCFQHRQKAKTIVDNNSKQTSSRKTDHHQKNFQSEFNHLRLEFGNCVSQLADRMETHHNKLEKQFKIFSKNMQKATIDASLEKYRREGESFPDIVKYKEKNLLDINDFGNHGRFARQVLKALFTPAEMSESILYTNSTYAKPGLDPVRMRIFKKAVCARFRISRSHWNEFFNLCLRRTLTQMICDVRKQYKNELKQQHQPQSISPTVRFSTNTEAHNHQQIENEYIETFD